MELKNINIIKDIKEKISTPIPDYLIKERSGGGNQKLNYISGSAVIDMLNNYFGYCWNWTVKEQWIQQSEPAYNKYVNGQYQKDPSKWVLEPQGPVANVLGTLEVFLIGDDNKIISIKKDGFGSKSIIGKQSEQESIFKAAGTDALKKAASLLGIGLQLYRKEEEQAYFESMNYENPWTDELLEKYEKEYSAISDYCDQYKLTDEDIAQIILAATGENELYILPSNIEAVYNYLSKGDSEE